MARIVVLSVLCMLTECLDVKTIGRQSLVLVERDILLHCYFAALEPIRIEDIAVKWTVRSGGVTKAVYMFDEGNINSLRPESSMNHKLLETGNASLYLPNLTLEDEGEYTCTVLIPPEVGEAKLVLNVAAQPTVILLPENPHVTNGEMKTFICKLSYFYPNDLNVKWIMKKKKEIILEKNICTGIPFQVENRTFMVDSQVSIVFTEEDDDNVILCEVIHQSLSQPLRKETTIHLAAVQAPGIVVPTVTTLLMGIVLILASAVLYWKFFVKVAPRVSELILPDLNMAGEKMVTLCNINGFRPKSVDICWYIEKSGQQGRSSHFEDDPLLHATNITGYAKHPVNKHGSLFNAISQLSYTPSIEDHEATLVCVVRHKALGAAIRRQSNIKVAVRPKKSYITSWPQDPCRGDKLTLSCVVERFFPKPISVTWLRNGQVQSPTAQFGPFPCENDYYSIWSQICLTVTEEEDGVMYTCQIKHISLQTVEELSYEINAKGTPPEVQFIVAEPVKPVIGQEILLSCKISSFFPRDIAVDWYKDGNMLDTESCHFLWVTNANGLHSLLTFLKLTPKAEDERSVFKCMVQHAALRNHEERTYTLTFSAT